MKFKYLFTDFRPQKKCGAGAVTAGSLLGSAGIGAGGSIINSVLQGSLSSHNVNKQLDAQREENALNRDWQTAEAEKARNWSAQQLSDQNQMTQENMGIQQGYNLQSMAQQAKYNSPVYMRQQLEKAGINPEVYFGNHSSFAGSSATAGGASSAPGVPGASTPGSVSGLSPVSYQPPDLQIPQLMSSFGSMMQNLASAKKQGVETDIIAKTAVDTVLKAVAERKLAEVNTGLAEMHKTIQESSLPFEVKMAEKRFEKIVSEIDLLKQEKLSTEQEVELKKATQALNESLTKLNDKQWETLDLRLRYLPRLLESEILSNRGSAAAGFGSAQQSKSQSRLTDLEYEMRRNMQGFIEGEYFQNFENLQKQGKIMDWQIDTAEAVAKQEMVNADHAEALFWKDFISDIFNDGVNAFLGYKNAKSWERLSKSSQDRTAAKIEQMKWEYGDKVKLEDTSPSGAKRTREYRRPYSKYGGTTD